MAKPKQSNVTERKKTTGNGTDPKSLEVSERGISTGAHFAGLMSALMSDIIAGRVTPAVGNAACNAGGKLLKVVEMQYKFGTQNGNQGNRVLMLTPDTQ